VARAGITTNAAKVASAVMREGRRKAIRFINTSGQHDTPRVNIIRGMLQVSFQCSALLLLLALFVPAQRKGNPQRLVLKAEN
jgi:hypothetical protein